MLDRALRVAEWALWGLAAVVAIAFVVIKLRNWGPLLQMAQHDFAVYYTVGRVAQIAPQSLYQMEQWTDLTGLSLEVGGPYLYAPTIAWFFGLFTLLPYPQAALAWLIVNAIVAVVVCGLIVFLWPARRAGVLGALLWLFLPATLDTAFLGNVNLVLALLLTCCVWLFVRRKIPDGFGGLLLGLAAAVKPFPIGLTLIGIWEQRWRFVFWAGIGWIAVTLAALPLHGAAYPDYWEILAHNLAEFAPPGLEIIQNQSLFAVWQKLAYNGTVVLTLSGDALGSLVISPWISPTVARYGAFASVLLVSVTVLWVLWQLDRGRVDAQLLVWGFMLTTMLILSPVSWWYYTVIIAPVYPALLTLRPRLTPAWRLLIPLGYLAILIQRGYVLWLPYAPLLALTSAILFGLLGWWAIFLRQIVRGGRQVRDEATRR